MVGHYLKEDKPDFLGDIAVNCIGTVKYAGNRVVGIRYLEEEYRMELDEPGKKEIWDKGKRFTFFILFQLRVYNIQMINVIKSVRNNNKSNKVSKISDKEIFNE